MNTILKSNSKEVTIGGGRPFVMIGEKINPTGRKKLAAALTEGNLDYVRQLALDQAAWGADVLDVNVGAPGIDEVAVVKQVVELVASVTDIRARAQRLAALHRELAAAEAQARIIALRGAAARAEDYAGLADLYVLATDGYVSPEAEAAVNAALARDPANGTARFYLGLMWAQTGRPDLAFRIWKALLEDGPEEAPWIPPIRDQIAFLAAAAGVNYTPPGALKGPTAGDMAAAAAMSAEDRMGMIRGMVEQLSDRLASEGGSVEEWARLISSLGVLGEKDRARTAWEAAQKAFAGQDSALDALRQAAEQAGVAG
jgi:cytochrome c-type biogenesis protein CcmH